MLPPIPTLAMSRTSSQSIPIILIKSPRKHHHPQQKHRAHNLHRKCRSPILTQRIILQPHQRRFTGPHPRYVPIAIGIDAAFGPVQHNGQLDQAGEPEDEADEGADDDDGGGEILL